jgi:flagellar biosynthesis/type III secretory pathway protein FliH
MKKDPEDRLRDFLSDKGGDEARELVDEFDDLLVERYEDGVSDGRDCGYDEGYEDGQLETSDTDYQTGYDDGYEAGLAEAGDE